MYNNAINSDVKKPRRSYLALQLFASGYGWRYRLLKMHVAENKPDAEKAKGDRCEANFYWRKRSPGAENISLRKSRV